MGNLPRIPSGYLAARNPRDNDGEPLSKCLGLDEGSAKESISIYTVKPEIKIGVTFDVANIDILKFL